MKPIRGEHSRKVVHDPWDRQEEPIRHADVAHVISADGALESANVERDFALGCGCLGKPPAGYCCVCEKPICGDCFGHCESDGCGRPLCRRHSLRFDGPNGKPHRLCRGCYETVARHRHLQRVGRMLLSPFIRFDDKP